ncbi:MAG: pitrilysin family protein [Verrucomicrobiota bacterium]
MDYPYRLTKLPNGTRIASIEMPYMKSVSVGFWAAIGGRHETARESGVAHFIEHLLFKGTKRRSAKKITESVEGIGGYLNAFTTEDHTCYYAKAAAPHLPHLCDVLNDMFQESKFAPTEIEREREVIREEILMYRDQHSQRVQELLTETMWPNHPLGRPLTGTVKTIGNLHREQLLRFHKRHYVGRSTIVTVAGPVAHEHAVQLLSPLLSSLPTGQSPRFIRSHTKQDQPLVCLNTQDTEQTHLAIGFRTFGRSDERRFALKLLSVILGENMSSRLFQKLRERHGFCYSIQSSVVTLADTGAFHISAGLDAANLEKAIRLILQELTNICQKPPSIAELKKARDYTIGQTLMGLESTSNQIIWMGESLLAYQRVLCPEETERQLLAVSPEEIQRVAAHVINPAHISLAIVGPVKNPEKIRSWLS